MQILPGTSALCAADVKKITIEGHAAPINKKNINILDCAM